MKRISRKEALKLYPNNRIMVTNEFGYPIYIAPSKNLQIQTTDKKEDAEKWSELDGSKLDYYKAVTGYKELALETLNN